MLSERYSSLLEREGVISDDGVLLGYEINSRKAFFRRVGMSNGGRTKSFRSGVYRHGNVQSSKPISQRVVVKAHFKRHGAGGFGGSGGAGNLRGHLGYITRDGAGIDGERPELFGSFNGVDEDLSRSDFYNLCKEDRHHFRVIISPENGHEISDFEGYIGRVMGAVSDDLDTKLEWVSAVHYDTDNVHAHVVLRGRDDLGKDLVIAPDYISNGIRMRAQELATEILGERSIEDIQRSMEQETNALRVTSLDRFIEKRGQEIDAGGDEFRVNIRGLGGSDVAEFKAHLVKKRLDFLSSTSMAREESRGIYNVRSDFMATLKETSEKHDIIKQLHRSMPEEALDEGVSIYKIEDGKAPVIRGEIEKIAHVNELTDNKYMVVRDSDNALHYVSLSLNDRNEALREGGVVEVSTGESASLKADRNILEIASLNDGVYSRDAHLDHVRSNMSFIKEPEGYVDYHGSRAGALSDAGIIEELEDGRYSVPDDVVERGVVLSAEQEANAKYKKKQYAQVKPLSVVPVKDSGFNIYDLTDADAPKLQGRIEQIDRVNAQSDKRYMLVRDGDEQTHYVPLFRSSDLKVGSIVEVSAAEKSKGGADYNIGMIASNNEGVYRREDHLKFIESSEKGKNIEDVDAYLDHHGTRLKTLEKAGIIEELGGGDYRIPKDVVERGDELNASMPDTKPRYAKVKAISAMPIESQIDVQARTFLDLEIYRHQKDYALSYDNADKGTLEAISKRQDWLVDNGYASHKGDTGEFVMKGDALGKLYEAELEVSSKIMAKGLNASGYRFIDSMHEQKDTMRYMGFVDLHSGHHIVAEKEGFITLIKSKSNTENWVVNEPVIISKSEKGMIIARDILEQSKEETLEILSEKVGMPSKEMDVSEGLSTSYIGAVHLKDGAYAAVSHDNHISLVRVKDYPVYGYGQELKISTGRDGFVEIREVDKQKELGLEIKEPEVEYEEKQLVRSEPEIEIDDDWWD